MAGRSLTDDLSARRMGQLDPSGGYLVAIVLLILRHRAATRAADESRAGGSAGVQCDSGSLANLVDERQRVSTLRTSTGAQVTGSGFALLDMDIGVRPFTTSPLVNPPGPQW